MTILPQSLSEMSHSPFGRESDFQIARIEMKSLSRRVTPAVDFRRSKGKGEWELHFERSVGEKEKREGRRGEKEGSGVFLTIPELEKNGVGTGSLRRVSLPRGAMISLYSLRMLGIIEAQKRLLFFSLLRLSMEGSHEPFLPQWIYLIRKREIENGHLFDFWLLDHSEVTRGSSSDTILDYESPINYSRNSGKGNRYERKLEIV